MQRALIFSVVVVAAALVLAGAELMARIGGRVTRGEWPSTAEWSSYQQQSDVLDIYQRHPFLNVAPRASSSVALGERSASFNELGYRGPDRPGPTQRPRILVAGGSAAFDLLASNDQASWPMLLEQRLKELGFEAEVWNAGFPGWTSLENVISLAVRDRDLQPKIALLFQGVNDIQPASLRPFDKEYVDHAAILRGALGFDTAPPSLLHRSILLAYFRPRLPPEEYSLARSIAPEAKQVFRRNVRSWVALARDSGATPVLVAQPMRVREDARAFDRNYLESWLRIEEAGAFRALDQLNETLREVASEHDGTLYVDATVILDRDEHFSDPFHFSQLGSQTLAEALAERLAGPQLLVSK
ncbi:MAG: SGNH/GDSL hydrolase family protein [Acidobacteriota bacterium]